jgi:hypothetical protein
MTRTTTKTMLLGDLVHEIFTHELKRQRDEQIAYVATEVALTELILASQAAARRRQAAALASGPARKAAATQGAYRPGTRPAIDDTLAPAA